MTAEEIRDIVQRVVDRHDNVRCEIVDDDVDSCIIGISDGVFVDDLQRISQDTLDPCILVDRAVLSENAIELYIQK